VCLPFPPPNVIVVGVGLEPTMYLFLCDYLLLLGYHVLGRVITTAFTRTLLAICINPRLTDLVCRAVTQQLTDTFNAL